MKKTEGKEPNLIDRYLEADWPRLREKGRSNFIWKYFVFPIGLPSAILGTLLVYHELNLNASDVTSAQGVGMIYIVFVFTGVSVYRYAAKEWAKREMDYLTKNPPNSTPSDEE